ncbi:MAG TPA: PAS domain-containing protein [Flavisolibacter sp.]|jgi:PAS domain S-box-containing protein|nr:PAS domain-containing protein [Flavisolibacter sp.]
MNTSRFFEHYYKQAQVNSIMILDTQGVVIDVNKGFTKNFGYTAEDIKGKNFSLLYTEADLEKNRPQNELEAVTTMGQASDENFVLDKSGHPIWCTGESILVPGEDDTKYIVKDIVNLQTRKQLQHLVTNTGELLNRVFQSSKDISILVLDGSMKIEKSNAAFLELFELQESPVPGSRLSDINHPFWNSEELKTSLRQLLIFNQPIKEQEFLLKTAAGKEKTIRVDSIITAGHEGTGKGIFIMLEDISGNATVGQTSGAENN